MSSSQPPGDAEVSTTRYGRLLEVQTLMARVSREIGPALDLQRVLKTVLEAVRDLVDCDGGLISLVEDQYLTVAAVTPEPDEAIPPVRLDGSERVRITSGWPQDLAPAWSPDVTRIAFSSERLEQVG